MGSHQWVNEISLKIKTTLKKKKSNESIQQKMQILIYNDYNFQTLWV